MCSWVVRSHKTILKVVLKVTIIIVRTRKKTRKRITTEVGSVKNCVGVRPGAASRCHNRPLFLIGSLLSFIIALPHSCWLV